jgi:mannose-6-phosphate isomerase-like protein (cupin superfamily)
VAQIDGEVWSLANALAAAAVSGRQYFQFFEQAEMSAGIYLLPAGSVDGQKPHLEDEIYYVISGRAIMSIAGDDTPVESGATIYVRKHVEHRFHSISQDLTILVIFAPAHSGVDSDRRPATRD